VSYFFHQARKLTIISATEHNRAIATGTLCQLMHRSRAGVASPFLDRSIQGGPTVRPARFSVTVPDGDIGRLFCGDAFARAQRHFLDDDRAARRQFTTNGILLFSRPFALPRECATSGSLHGDPSMSAPSTTVNYRGHPVSTRGNRGFLELPRRSSAKASQLFSRFDTTKSFEKRQIVEAINLNRSTVQRSDG